jgi:tetratricopeptide (TPR) repeat protein
MALKFSRNILLLVLILTTALAIRFAYFYEIKDDFFFQTPYMDAQYYDNWASEIVKSGDWLSSRRGVFVMSPGYSYFLAVIYTLFGRNISLVAAIQLLIGSISCVLVFLIARKVAMSSLNSDEIDKKENKKRIDVPAVISALLSAAYGLSLFYEAILVKAALINFVNLSMLYLLILGSEKNRSIYFLSAGLCLGYSVHLRPNILLFIPFLIILHFANIKKRKGASPGALSTLHLWKRQIFTITLFLLGLMIFMVAGGLRNYVVGRQFVMTTAHGGMNFYTGNNPQSLGPYFGLPFADPNPEDEIKGFHAEAERRAGHGLTNEEADKLWYQESWDFVSKQPVKWLLLVARKILIFLNNYEDSINLDYEVFRKESNSILNLPLMTYGIVLPLGLWGIIVCGWKNYAARLLTLYFMSYFVATIAFFVVSEYRYPVVPVLTIFAGQGIWFFINSQNAKRYVMKILGIVFLLFSIWLANKDIYNDWFGLHTYHETILSNAYSSMGTVYAENNHTDKAMEFYNKAIKIKPNPGPLIKIGALYAKKGMLTEAKETFENVVHLYPQDPGSAEAYVSLGLMSLNEKKTQIAEYYFQQAYRLKTQSMK